MEHSEDSQQVEKMGHHSDSTKNRTSIQNWWKDTMAEIRKIWEAA